jgi:epoxyqueuosine reductase
MVRNAAIAAGNSGDTAFIPVLARLRNDDDPVVAEAASWALAQLGANDGRAPVKPVAPQGS